MSGSEILPSAPIEGANFKSTSNVPFVSGTSTSGLPSNDTTMAIEAASTNLGTYTMPWPSTPSAKEFKSQLEAKDVVIACLQEDAQNLVHETKERNFPDGKSCPCRG
jgi:hypothetical protein